MESTRLLAEVESRAAELARLDEEYRTARVTARSRDRLVAVTVDVRGRVVDVDLHAGVQRTHAPAALAQLIVELAGQAADSLGTHYARRAALAVGGVR
ncbi:YbaB/EbfC family nucleoid-associated protein [Tsukamurella sp. 8F]|uniref:YbaB/EbfC family nucleoid-associated protein n=1 Tax=unclassified Tsukamurella TaxID=2633480 RepID=UPI0023B8919A|nr:MULTISPECIES: YbaB/EbfC family nucleoid-associated protein [unclassified Tsukamurella]MDF0531248.1 YbaB/EbfC family nucleoid-associated protein [Tsukamurella sp. 8J]MDF0588517.1 YbaB/EbfC family nucleoid-associated protein [Tsukamurella sp. 8F]